MDKPKILCKDCIYHDTYLYRDAVTTHCCIIPELDVTGYDIVDGAPLFYPVDCDERNADGHCKYFKKKKKPWWKFW